MAAGLCPRLRGLPPGKNRTAVRTLLILIHIRACCTGAAYIRAGCTQLGYRTTYRIHITYIIYISHFFVTYISHNVYRPRYKPIRHIVQADTQAPMRYVRYVSDICTIWTHIPAAADMCMICSHDMSAKATPPRSQM